MAILESTQQDRILYREVQHTIFPGQLAEFDITRNEHLAVADWDSLRWSERWPFQFKRIAYLAKRNLIQKPAVRRARRKPQQAVQADASPGTHLSGPRGPRRSWHLCGGGSTAGCPGVVGPVPRPVSMSTGMLVCVGRVVNEVS